MTSPSNPYASRWRWWYGSIADFMLANPGCTDAQIAAAMKKYPSTINCIRNTDLFKSFFAERQKQFREGHDAAITNKFYRATEASLDILLDQLEKKGDKIPFETNLRILDRVSRPLGYGGDSPAVQVNMNSVDQSKHVTISGVSVDQIEEARAAMRRQQELRSLEPMEQKLLAPAPPENELLDEVDLVPLPAERRS